MLPGAFACKYDGLFNHAESDRKQPQCPGFSWDVRRARVPPVERLTGPSNTTKVAKGRTASFCASAYALAVEFFDEHSGSTNHDLGLCGLFWLCFAARPRLALRLWPAFSWLGSLRARRIGHCRLPPSLLYDPAWHEGLHAPGGSRQPWRRVSRSSLRQSCASLPIVPVFWHSAVVASRCPNRTCPGSHGATHTGRPRARARSPAAVSLASSASRSFAPLSRCFGRSVGRIVRLASPWVHHAP